VRPQFLVFGGCAIFRVCRCIYGHGCCPKGPDGKKTTVAPAARRRVFVSLGAGTVVVWVGCVLLWYAGNSLPVLLGGNGLLGSVSNLLDDYEGLETAATESARAAAAALAAGTKDQFRSEAEGDALVAAAAEYVSSSARARAVAENTREDFTWLVYEYVNGMVGVSVGIAVIVGLVGLFSYWEKRGCIHCGAALAFPFLMLAAGACSVGIVVWIFWQDTCYEAGRFLEVYASGGPARACGEPITELFPCPDTATLEPYVRQGMLATNALVEDANWVLWDYDQGKFPVTGRYGFLCPRFAFPPAVDAGKGCSFVLAPSETEEALTEQCRFNNQPVKSRATCADLIGTRWADGTMLDEVALFDNLECKEEDIGSTEVDDSRFCRAVPGLGMDPATGLWDPALGPRGKITRSVFAEFKAKADAAVALTAALGPDSLGRAPRAGPLVTFLRDLDQRHCHEISRELYLMWIGFGCIGLGAQVLCIAYVCAQYKVRLPQVHQEDKTAEMRAIYGSPPAQAPPKGHDRKSLFGKSKATADYSDEDSDVDIP